MTRMKFCYRVLLVTYVLQFGIVKSCWGLFDRVGEYIGHQASKELRQASENSAKELTTGLKEITNSLDNGVAVGQQVFREFSHNVTNLLDNFDVRINSGDLAHVGADAAHNLQIALSDLSKNWKLAIKSEDFKSIGEEASRHLSQALQNLSAKIHVHGSIDENIRDAKLYIAVAIGIAFSVCFVAIIVSLKSCRKCLMGVVKSLKGYTCNCCIIVKNGEIVGKAAKPKVNNVEIENLDCRDPFLSPREDIEKWSRENAINGDGTNLTDHMRKSLASMRGLGYEGFDPLPSIFDKNQHNFNLNWKSANRQTARTHVFREFRREI